jgi:hypothetical protein
LPFFKTVADKITEKDTAWSGRRDKMKMSPVMLLVFVLIAAAVLVTATYFFGPLAGAAGLAVVLVIAELYPKWKKRQGKEISPRIVP